MSEGLEVSPLATFSTREWASWLTHGIRAYFHLTVMPPSFSPNDAFPLAKRYIGLNPSDLAADLIDMERDLPAPAQARFEEAVIVTWADLDFDRSEHYVIGSTALSLARKGRMRGIVDVIPASLPRLRYALRRQDLVEIAAKLRTEMFAAAIDLASATSRSSGTIRALLDVQTTDAKFKFATGEQALSGLARLCSAMPSEMERWIALFARTISDGVDLKNRDVSRAIHNALEKVCGRDPLNDVIDKMRNWAQADASPTDGQITMRHWIEADAFLAAISPLPQPLRLAPKGSRAQQRSNTMSADEIAERLNID